MRANPDREGEAVKKIVDDMRLMIKACDLYYNQAVGQQQIAQELGISRPTVSRLLSAAREQGVVQIQVAGLDTVQHWALERQLQDRYGLKDVMIVDSGSQDSDTRHILGRAAARYLEANIRDNCTVGISMGGTLHAVTSHVTCPRAAGVTFVPLIGGMGQLRMELHSNSLAENLARKYGGRFVPLHAPARVSSGSIRRELQREKSVAEALRVGEQVDLAVVGIGFPNENSAIQATGYFQEKEVESLLERQVAGEICMQFYDIAGDTAPYQNDNHVIGMELRKLRKVPCSVGVAGGADKSRAVLGAIRGRYINVLITDLACARALLENGGEQV